MVNQGRLAKVLFALMGAMTLGTFVLLLMENQPIEPMEFSLSSPAQMRSIPSVLGTEPGIELADWTRVEVCYRRNEQQLTADRGLVGDFNRTYHFVISDGSVGCDGQIFASHRWTKQLTCIDTNGLPVSQGSIRICMVGDPEYSVSTPSQAQKLEQLVTCLVRHCQLAPTIIWTTH